MTASNAAPDLTAADIPFSATGYSHGIVEAPVDAATYRELTQAALDELAHKIARVNQAARIIVALREENRRLRADRSVR